METELASARVEIQHKQGKITALSTENDYLRQHLAERETMLRKTNDVGLNLPPFESILTYQTVTIDLFPGIVLIWKKMGKGWCQW